MSTIDEKLKSMREPLVTELGELLPLLMMLEKYPRFCETQCTAWNELYDRCMVFMTGGLHCYWTKDKIEDRIGSLTKVNGTTWWKKRVK